MEWLHFLATARPPRENWLKTMSDEEKAVMEQHFAYTTQMYIQGTIVFAGACKGGSIGLIVYRARSGEAAQALFEADPLVKSGIMDTALVPFQLGHMFAEQ